MSVDYTQGVTGRDPLGKTLVEALLDSHPDWSDQQIADRINQECGEPAMTVDEVAYWREQAS